MVLDVPLLDVIEEPVLLEGFLPESEDVVLGLAGGCGQQVGDGLEDGADGLTKSTFRTPPLSGDLCCAFCLAKGSGEMLSFSVSTRNAEINDVSCWMSIIIFADFQFSAIVE